MIMKYRRMFLSLVLGSLVALASVSIASADAPVVEGPIHLEGSVLVADCGEFQVVDNYLQDQTRQLFFDTEGNLVKAIIQISGTDTFVNSVTGKAYSGSYHNTAIVDPVLRRAATLGVIFRLAVPGSGAVFLDVGRVVSDREGNIYFEAGPHQYVDGDFDGLCAALEG